MEQIGVVLQQSPERIFWFLSARLCHEFWSLSVYREVYRLLVEFVKSSFAKRVPAAIYNLDSTFFRHSWNSFQSYMMAAHLVSSVRSLAICSIFSLPSSMP
jgi:hypothetical protein